MVEAIAADEEDSSASASNTSTSSSQASSDGACHLQSRFHGESAQIEEATVAEEVDEVPP